MSLYLPNPPPPLLARLFLSCSKFWRTNTKKIWLPAAPGLNEDNGGKDGDPCDSETISNNDTSDKTGSDSESSTDATSDAQSDITSEDDASVSSLRYT